MPHQALQDLQGNRFPNPGPDRSVRHFPDPRFSLLPVRLLRRSMGIFSVVTSSAAG